MEDKAGPNATSASTAGLAEQEPPNVSIYGSINFFHKKKQKCQNFSSFRIS